MRRTDFNFDYFNPSLPNQTVGKIKFHRFEIMPMIENYLEYHVSSHPVTKHIIELLYAVDYFLLMTDENHYSKMSDKAYLEYDHQLAKKIDEYSNLIKSPSLGFKDKTLLTSSLQYILNCIKHQSDQMKLLEPEKSKQRNQQSHLHAADITREGQPRMK